jgi:hypothetical protein
LETLGDSYMPPIGNAIGKTAKYLGSAAYNIAGTKGGAGALAAGTGIFLTRKLFDIRDKHLDEKEKYQEAPLDFTPKKDKKPVKKLNLKPLSEQPTFDNSILEQNLNLPRYPGLPYKIQRNPRSVANYLLNRKNSYRNTAEQKQAELQTKIGLSNMKKTKAVTGYDRVIGKLSA